MFVIKILFIQYLIYEIIIYYQIQTGFRIKNENYEMP